MHSAAAMEHLLYQERELISDGGGSLLWHWGVLVWGFAQTGNFQVALGVDIKECSIRTFSANHPLALALCKDIRQINVVDLHERLGHDLDVIIGGPPCQGFSSIRPYRSIVENDHRNNLFEQFVALVGHFRPRFVVFENVVGLMHHKGGTVLREIQESIESLGYSMCTGVLNTVHYGIPQRRERLVLLAQRGNRRPHFPKPTHHYCGRNMAKVPDTASLPLLTHDLPPAVTVGEAINDLAPVAAGQISSKYRVDITPSEYACARRKRCDQVTLHSATAHTLGMLEIIRKAGTNRWALPDGLTTSGFSSSYSRLLPDEPSPTITVNFVHPASNRCIHPDQDRALTVREGARLQSFNDDYVLCGSRTQIVKQIGEAVPPLLGQAIAKAILEQW